MDKIEDAWNAKVRSKLLISNGKRVSFLSLCLALFCVGLDLSAFGRSSEQKAFFNQYEQFLEKVSPLVISIQTKGLKDYNLSDLNNGSYLKDQELVSEGFKNLVNIGIVAMKKFNSFPPSMMSNEIVEKVGQMGKTIGMVSEIFAQSKSIRQRGLSLLINTPKDMKLVENAIKNEESMLELGLLNSVDELNDEMKKGEIGDGDNLVGSRPIEIIGAFPA